MCEIFNYLLALRARIWRRRRNGEFIVLLMRPKSARIESTQGIKLDLFVLFQIFLLVPLLLLCLPLQVQWAVQQLSVGYVVAVHTGKII